MKKILTLLALLWGLPAAAQGIPTGGEGSLCIATANAPTLAQGNFAVLSCDLSGQLRTASAGGATGSVTAPGTSGSQAQAVQGVTGGVPLPTLAPSDTRSSATLNLTSTSNVVTIPVPDGAATLSYNLTGVTGSGASLTLGLSTDGTNYFAFGTAYARSGPGSLLSGLTADNTGARYISVAGLRTVQLQVATAGTGTATIAYTFSVAPNPPNGTVQVSAAVGGVQTVSRLTSSAASTNLTAAKLAPGRVYKIFACNTTTTPARIKFYNALSASVTVGTTAPFLTRPIPAAASAGGLACASYDMADVGWYFSTGISYALVTGSADSDATAVAAGAITDVSVEVQ